MSKRIDSNIWKKAGKEKNVFAMLLIVLRPVKICRILLNWLIQQTIDVICRRMIHTHAIETFFPHFYYNFIVCGGFSLLWTLFVCACNIVARGCKTEGGGGKCEEWERKKRIKRQMNLYAKKGIITQKWPVCQFVSLLHRIKCCTFPAFSLRFH